MNILRKLLSHSTVGRIVVLAGLAASNWSCAPTSPAKCDALQLSALEAMVREQISPEQIATQVMAAYSVSRDAIVEYQEATPNLVAVDWNTRGQGFSALFDNGRLRKIDQYFHDTKVTVDDLLACLGQPDSYSATFRWGPERRVLDLSLYYPQQGLIASAYVFTRANAAPSIDGGLTIDWLAVTEPGDIRQVMASSHTYPQSPDTLDEMLQQISRWPGSLDLIVVDDQTAE